MKTLSNFHQQKGLAARLFQKKKGEDGRQEMGRSHVPCPVQNKTYSGTFRQIDKVNGAESKFYLVDESHTHGW